MASYPSARGVGIRVVCTVILVLALGSAPAAWTQVSPNGPEFQVNTYTTGTQSAPALAVGAQGSFVVVWDSYGLERHRYVL